jgi:hypothetical protein
LEHTDAVIQRGADDSMYVTNATPQMMQAFNTPVWLGLRATLFFTRVKTTKKSPCSPDLALQ